MTLNIARATSADLPRFDAAAVRDHFEMIHRLAAAADTDGILLLVRIEQRPTQAKGTLNLERFAIGDVDRMVGNVMASQEMRHVNLYAPWAIFRREIDPRSKGKEADVIAVLALVADMDSDTGKFGSLPCDAPYVIESSAGNSQQVFPLSRPLSVAEAKPLATQLANFVGCDVRTKDMSGVWRIPGTLNWPTPNKLARGRSLEPQPVTILTKWCGELIEPEHLRAALPAPAPNVATLDNESSSGEHSFDDLSAGLKKLIAAPPFDGEDQSNTAASVFQQLRARGWNDDEIKTVIEAHRGGIGKRYAEGKDLDADLKRTATKWDRPEPTNISTTLFDPWDRFVVPAFPLDVFPTHVAEFVDTHSSVIGCDRSALAMAVLANFSAAIDHRFALKIMKHGDWWVSPRLWVLLVGDPSRKKTPIINAAVCELEAQQIGLREQYEQQKQLHLASGGDPNDGPSLPLRHVVFDVTVEKLAEMLSRQDRGVLVKRDEFAGFIGSMERYGSGKGASADRAFWLQAFDGGPYTVDRISRGESFVRNLSVSLIGGIQPARLGELHGLTSDGLLQRFLPVMMGPASFPCDTESNGLKYRLMTRHLLGLEPRRLLLTDDAILAMENLRRHLHDLEQSSVGLADGFTAFLGKLAGYAGSLTLILHIIGADGSACRVTSETVERASLLIKNFLLPHAFEFYRTTDRASAGDRLQRLASWILTNGKSRIVPSDFTSNVADLKGIGLWELNQRVSPLVAGGWLIPNDKAPVTRSWSVSPQVFERFKQQAVVEEERKTRLAELMHSPRKARR